MTTNRIPDKVKYTSGVDTIIRVTGLYYLNPVESGLPRHFFDGTAQVTVTMKDSLDNPVAGCVDLPLAYVAASNGDFAGVVEDSYKPAPGTGYILEITAMQGAAKRVFSIVCEVIE